MSTRAQRSARRRRSISTALGGTLGALCLAPAAFAGTASVNGTTLVYDAGPGETNSVSVTRLTPTEYRVGDQVPITAGPGCATEDGSGGVAVTCTSGEPFSAVAVNLGDRPDTAVIGSEVDIAARVDGGDGRDIMTGGGAGDALIGAAGDDAFLGSGGNDSYDAGAGNDTYFQALEGGDAGGDLFNGGPGVDTADYSGFEDDDEFSGVADPPRFLSLDDLQNDGAPNEGDNLVDVEDAFGGSGDDVVTGNGEGNTLGGGGGRDRVDGGPGVDSVDGGAEEDVVIGGDGSDDVFGSGGDDGLDAGQGDDNLAGGSGQDSLAGGTGDDNLDGGSGSDSLGGGEGIDTVDYTLRFGSVDDEDFDASRTNVTLDGVADDGFAGENDNAATDVENVATGAGNDLVRGGAAVNGIITGAGNDIIDTRDQVPDNVVCGAGFDAVRADGLDQVDVEGEDRCERVEVVGTTPPGPTPPPPGPKPDPTRVKPKSIVVSVSPGRDRRAPYSFRTRGRLSLPTGLSPATACKGGRVSIQIKRGTKTVSTRRVALRSSCTFSSTVTFSRSRRNARGRLKVTARFLGNDVLERISARSRSVRAG